MPFQRRANGDGTPTSSQPRQNSKPLVPDGQRWWVALCLVVVIYSFLAGLRTVTDFDLGWQMATGRWIVAHHQIPSTDLFSYTASGQPWIYPAGSALLFYATYSLGGWPLLSWLGALICAATVAISLRRGNRFAAALAIVAIPRIALHTTPRADMFTVLLFAAFLSILWEQHQTGHAKLWLLPILAAAWVNLHLGFISGLALLGAYVAIEIVDMIWLEGRSTAIRHLRTSLPWLAATVAATLLNPWGLGIYKAILRQNAAMAEHSQSIIEWASAQISWALLRDGVFLRNTGGVFYTMLLLAAVAVVAALYRRQLGAAALLGAAAWLSVRHIRFQALFAVVLVIVGGAALSSAWDAVHKYFKGERLRTAVAATAMLLMITLAAVRSFDLISDKTYLGTTDLGSFGTGLSWWFPENAAAFVEREKLPGQMFNSYNEGGFLTWRLGEHYPDYIDGRAIPFGSELFQRNGEVLGTAPDSPEWQREAEQYGINFIVVPLGRYNALQFFPVLRQFCRSENWRPVYLDEVSAVFLRSTPQTESLIARLALECDSAAIPPNPPTAHDSKAFNRWANAAAVLQALGRNEESLAATTQALAIFSDTAFVHFLRGNLLRDAGNLRDAEEQYRLAASFESNAATWSALADLYQTEGRREEEIHAREQAVTLLAKPAVALLSLGYTYLDLHRPENALRTFSRAESTVLRGQADTSYLANLSHGRALAWMALGNISRAISFEEETVRLTPDRIDDWVQLADMYEHDQRPQEARQARERVQMLRTGMLH